MCFAMSKRNAFDRARRSFTGCALFYSLPHSARASLPLFLLWQLRLSYPRISTKIKPKDDDVLLFAKPNQADRGGTRSLIRQVV